MCCATLKELEQMAKKLTSDCKISLHKIHQISGVITKQRPDVPPTRDELEHLGVTKRDLKDLEYLGLIKNRTMIVTQTNGNGRTTTGRVVYTITTLGREVCAQLGFISESEPEPIQAEPIQAEPIQAEPESIQANPVDPEDPVDPEENFCHDEVFSGATVPVEPEIVNVGE